MTAIIISLCVPLDILGKEVFTVLNFEKTINLDFDHPVYFQSNVIHCTVRALQSAHVEATLPLLLRQLANSEEKRNTV